jgi:hypothetical protein
VGAPAAFRASISGAPATTSGGGTRRTHVSTTYAQHEHNGSNTLGQQQFNSHISNAYIQVCM